MKFSHNWLQTFFEAPLPDPSIISDKLTFHSSEIEEVVTVGEDTVYDVKVLPDKSAWLMSHRGLAKEISVILNIPLKHDFLHNNLENTNLLSDVQIVLDTTTCDFYSVAVIDGVKVGPTPLWLRDRLEAIGQRSINNIVDATNYVMFELGQPLHAFDANTFENNNSLQLVVKIRNAKVGEKLTTLSNEELILSEQDAVITDGVSGQILALAGIKGGLNSGVTEKTTTILLESAHFERVAIRLGAQRHKLPTDAAKRYENGLSRSVALYGLNACAKLISEIAGGNIVGSSTAGDCIVLRKPVSVALTDINRVLGIKLNVETVSGIFNRFGYQYTISGEEFIVNPPHERDDIEIKQDLIEEVGRMHGLSNIVSIAPVAQPVAEINTRHYYAEKIRTSLSALGFSEVYTSSFRNKDIAHIKNALASDKSYLRSKLMDNLIEVRTRNIPYRDLLGITAVQVFEIGTVFNVDTEAFHVGLAVQTGTEYKAKQDESLLALALNVLEASLETKLTLVHSAPGYIEFSLEALLPKLVKPTVYDLLEKSPAVLYKPFSLYPSVSRDVAMWVSEGVKVSVVEAALRAASGDQLVRLTHLDTFAKDGRTSLAFRLVFQSYEKTLDGSEVDTQMNAVYDIVSGAGWEVR